MADNAELTGILVKIAHRAAWEEWSLSEAEFETLELASGELITHIAYKNNLPFNQLLRNADELVDDHNDKVQRHILKTLKELKQDLLSDTPRTKKVVPPPPDSVEIERRLLEETIEEIAGFRSQEEEAEEAVPAVAEQSLNLWDVDIEAEMKKHGLPFEVRFRGEEDPSMHRNAASSLNIEPLGDFGEASLRDVAQSGHFEGDRGRALYESLKTRDNSTPARISEIARGRLAQSTPLQLISQQIVPDIEITPAAEDLELPPVDKTAEPLVAEPTEPAQPTETRPSASTSRVSDYFLKLAIEADLKKKAQSKPRRKPRRKQRAQSPVEEGEDEFTEMNRPLIRHKRRPRATRQHKPAVRMMPMFDIFDGLDEYEPDREKVSEEPVVERAQTVAKPDAMPSAEISISAAVQDIAQISDIIPQAPEDLASILGFEQPTTTQKERDQATPVSDAFVSKRPRIETSLEQPRISMLRATDGGTPSRITADDVEFSELQAISEQAKAKERGEKTPIPMILREAVEATEALRAKKAPPAEPALEDEPVLFRIVDGPIEKMVEFVGVNGTIERHTEYSMDTMMFYFQIRCFMKQRRSWNMKWADIYPHVSLLKPVTKQKMELRLYALADHDFIKLTMSDDDEEIIDIEIPIRK